MDTDGGQADILLPVATQQRSVPAIALVWRILLLSLQTSFASDAQTSVKTQGKFEG